MPLTLKQMTPNGGTDVVLKVISTMTKFTLESYLGYGCHDGLDLFPLNSTFLGIRLHQVCRVNIKLGEELRLQMDRCDSLELCTHLQKT